VVLLAHDPRYKPLDATACALVLAGTSWNRFILFTGTLEPRKNVRLLAAYRALRERPPPA